MPDNKDMRSTEDIDNSEETVLDEEEIDQEVSSSDEASPSEEADAADDTQEEMAALEDRVIRLQAEIQNLQRRNRKDREDSAKFRSQKLAEAIIPALDNLERVLELEVSTDEGENIQKGVDMVLQAFYSAFDQESIQVIDPAGEPFNPNIHEALTTVPAENGEEAGTIAQVLQKGYVLNDRVLRAAQVIIYQ